MYQRTPSVFFLDWFHHTKRAQIRAEIGPSIPRFPINAGKIYTPCCSKLLPFILNQLLISQINTVSTIKNHSLFVVLKSHLCCSAISTEQSDRAMSFHLYEGFVETGQGVFQHHGIPTKIQQLWGQPNKNVGPNSFGCNKDVLQFTGVCYKQRIIPQFKPARVMLKFPQKSTNKQKNAKP